MSKQYEEDNISDILYESANIAISNAKLRLWRFWLLFITSQLIILAVIYWLFGVVAAISIAIGFFIGTISGIIASKVSG